ncbi:unnamed protein product, partial [Discosporangium mesarthrocarpum]
MVVGALSYPNSGEFGAYEVRQRETKYSVVHMKSFCLLFDVYSGSVDGVPACGQCVVCPVLLQYSRKNMFFSPPTVFRSAPPAPPQPPIPSVCLLDYQVLFPQLTRHQQSMLPHYQPF